MNKQGVLVTGPESSGTKLVTRLLMDMGFIGSYDHEQFLDEKYKKKTNLIHNDYVFRRSVPHALKYPDYVDIKNWFIDNKLEFKTIITVRNFTPCIQSKIKNKHNPTNITTEVLQEQIHFIFTFCPILKPFLIVDTSALTFNPGRNLKEICSFLNKPLIRPQYIYDMDKPYYE